MKRHKSDVFIRLFFILTLIWIRSYQSIIIFIALFQLFAIFFEKKPIDSLVIISQYLLSYIFDILEYITGISSTPPAPFSPWRNRYDP